MKTLDGTGGTALLNKRSEIDAAIVRYCSGARARFAACSDTRNNRQFLLDYVEKVTFLNDKVSIHGRIPVRGQSHEEKSFLQFRWDTYLGAIFVTKKGADVVVGVA